MSVDKLRAALASTGQDDALIKQVLSLWPLVEGLLEAFSKATDVPISGFLGGAQIFQSSMETMPPFCQQMLGAPATATRCVADGARRAAADDQGLYFNGTTHYCHAGMLNGRRDIETVVVGTLTLFFGSTKSINKDAVKRRESAIEAARAVDVALAERLQAADESDTRGGDIDPSATALINVIADTIEQLIRVTVGLRSFMRNMTHELSLVMLETGLLAAEMENAIELLGSANVDQVRSELQRQRRHILDQSQLGLHIVRNFLSHTSETHYSEAVPTHFVEINLNELLSDLIDQHKQSAASKNIRFHVSGLTLPKILGLPMEIRRLFHNVLNNAIKYSYHSIPETQRTIVIRSKVPYDPGFARLRFAIAIENYGIGLAKDEIHNVFKAGFRGRQAAAEVPIGAGIGLSEALKIMKLHGGDIKIRSRPVHETDVSGLTYVTSVELVFPYRNQI